MCLTDIDLNMTYTTQMTKKYNLVHLLSIAYESLYGSRPRRPERLVYMNQMIFPFIFLFLSLILSLSFLFLPISYSFPAYCIKLLNLKRNTIA